MAYASVEELTDYMGTDPMPSNPARLLERASDKVDELLIGAEYETDDEGNPTETLVISALKKATLAQAHYMTAAGDETNASQQFTSVTQGSISYARSAEAASQSRFSSDAVGVLRVAGLLPVAPYLV